MSVTLQGNVREPAFHIAGQSVNQGLERSNGRKED